MGERNLTTSAAGPPPVPFVLAVGRHRPSRRRPAAGQRADPARAHSRRPPADRAIGPRASGCRARLLRAGEPRLRFVSPIADGADQIAAEVALELGWELEAILPFERADYRASLANHGARERFDALIERASCLLELPGDPDHGLDAYVMTGRATVAHCDMLIAIWDGLPPRGRGGTGEVVQLALDPRHGDHPRSARPGGDTRILWSAFDPTVVTIADDPGVARPLDRRDVDALLRGLLMPPPDEQEQRSSTASCPSGCGASGRGSNIRCC